MERLKQMLQDDPNDQFLNYGLALELEKAEQFDEALSIFKKLVAAEPAYVPAFFMAGQMLSKIDRSQEARTFLTEGITAATQQGNSHAAAEMTEFLNMIED